MGATSGLDIEFFKRFRETWMKLNKKVYIIASNEVADEFHSAILGFLEYHLSTQKQQSGDY